MLKNSKNTSFINGHVLLNYYVYIMFLSFLDSHLQISKIPWDYLLKWRSFGLLLGDAFLCCFSLSLSLSLCHSHTHTLSSKVPLLMYLMKSYGRFHPFLVILVFKKWEDDSLKGKTRTALICYHTWFSKEKKYCKKKVWIWSHLFKYGYFPRLLAICIHVKILIFNVYHLCTCCLFMLSTYLAVLFT